MPGASTKAKYTFKGSVRVILDCKICFNDVWMNSYNKTHLFETNSHSLFPRWFSESGKLVQNLFSTVAEMTREEEDFLVLLIGA